MDFEKIVEFLPIGITIWRTESDYRTDDDLTDFRLIYANTQASIETGQDLFSEVGRRLDSLPPIISNSYPCIPDIWARVLISKAPENFEKTICTQVMDAATRPKSENKNICIYNMCKKTKYIHFPKLSYTSFNLPQHEKHLNLFLQFRETVTQFCSPADFSSV